MSKAKFISEMDSYFKDKKKLAKLFKDSWLNDPDGMDERIENEVSYNPDYSEEKEKGELTPDQKKSIGNSLIHDRFANFYSDFKSKATESKGKIVAYRCISVDDVDEFLFHVANGTPVENYEGIGVFWAWDKKRAACHWGHDTGSKVTVHAQIPYDSLDVYYTLMLNLSLSLGEDEAEIRLKEGAPVEIIGVEHGKELISPLDEGHPPIQMQARVRAALKFVQAFQDSGSMSVGPNTENLSPGNAEQMVEVGLPNQEMQFGVPEPTFEVREAIPKSPYYLGREEHFMPNPVKYPSTTKILLNDRVMRYVDKKQSEEKDVAPIDESPDREEIEDQEVTERPGDRAGSLPE